MNYIMRLLIVEDENDLRNIVKKRLVKEHYSVDACGDGLEAMDYIDMTSYDGIILDIMLPGKDGYEILRELRRREDDTPVLLLTAKDSIEDRVKGLDLGADDYLIKPFAFEELLARIRVMMRRKPQFTSNQLKIADLILDRDTRKVTRAGNEIDLSAKEFMVLECLMRNKNIVMTRQQIEKEPDSRFFFKIYRKYRGTNMELMEDGTTIEQQMFAMAAEKKVPLYGVLELLPLCNLNCDMCYVRMSREEMKEVGRLRTMEEWTKTAEDMMKAGTLFVLLTGGEPLLYPHFRELYQKLRELGMIITINTNGTLIDEAWADFFAENKPRRINITLYGASNETYERLCHYPGGFDKAVNGIRLLRERNIDVKVNGSLARANVDDRMKIIELGESLDAPVRIDTYMYPSVRERNHAYNNQARLDPEMAAKARVEVLQREMGEEVFAQYRKIQLDEAENTPEGEAVPGQMACRAGKSSFVVNWQGEMRSV